MLLPNLTYIVSILATDVGLLIVIASLYYWTFNPEWLTDFDVRYSFFCLTNTVFAACTALGYLQLNHGMFTFCYGVLVLSLLISTLDVVIEWLLQKKQR